MADVPNFIKVKSCRRAGRTRSHDEGFRNVRTGEPQLAHRGIRVVTSIESINGFLTYAVLDSSVATSTRNGVNPNKVSQL